jgi:membrane protease YdiL (CAAX protease family)
MESLLTFGLIISLFGTFLLLYVFKRSGIDSLHYYPRISLWVLALSVFLIAYTGTDLWEEQLGLSPLSWRAAAIAIGATAFLFVSWPLVQYVQKACGGDLIEQSETFTNIANISFSYRLFLIVTAAVTEELLYRGYAIGIGQHLLGSVWLSTALSIIVFTLAHVRWGLSHLFTVFWGSLIFSCIFIYTQSLWACIIAHVCIDAVGFLLVPAIKVHYNERVLSETNAD